MESKKHKHKQKKTNKEKETNDDVQEIKKHTYKPHTWFDIHFECI